MPLGCSPPPTHTHRPLWSTAFQTPLGDFDALIKLNRKRLRHLADDGSHVIGEDVSPSVKCTWDVQAGFAVSLCMVADSLFTTCVLCAPAKWVVPLYRNMQASSRRSLMIGFDPLQTYVTQCRVAAQRNAPRFACIKPPWIVRGM